jgi:hypothetical protein
MTKHDPCEYIRSYYRMPWLAIGVSVRALGCVGEVTGACHYVHVRLHGESRSCPYHPHDVTPAEQPAPKLRRRSKPARVTEHIRRSDRAVTCYRCRVLILPGQRYRQLIGVQQEWAEEDFRLVRAHSECVAGLARWTVTA